MKRPELWSTYLAGLMDKVPAGTQARNAVNAALEEYETTIRAVTKSKANVQALDMRIDAARSDLAHKLLKLHGREQQQQQPAEQLPDQAEADQPSPLDKLIDERGNHD